MTERRETGQKNRRGKPPRRKPAPKTNKRNTLAEPDWSEGERIAKYLARAGVASRREAERLIENGVVTVNGVRLTSPAFKVTGQETIKVHRKIISAPEPTRLWRYHKPAGLITTTSDPDGRRTVFEELPKSLPRTVTVGRLDLNTEGLLLLTNDGALARALELPKTQITRTYRARAHGYLTDAKIEALAKGVTAEGVRYGAIKIELDTSNGANIWVNVSLEEGKKREVRRALEVVDLKVNRLIRVGYGPFELADLAPGAVEEIPAETLIETVGEHIAPEHKPPVRTCSNAPKSRLHRGRGSARIKKGNRRPKND